MGMRPLELVWYPTLVKQHEVRVTRIGGLFTDRLALVVDGAERMTVPAGGFAGRAGRYEFELDGQMAELVWQYSPWTGDPRAIALVAGETVLASCGTPDAVQKALRQLRALRWNGRGG